MPNENGYNPLSGGDVTQQQYQPGTVANNEPAIISNPQQDYPMRQPPQKPFTRIRIFFRAPLEVSISSKNDVVTSTYTGRRFPTLSVFGSVGIVGTQSNGVRGNTSVMLSVEDWYRWLIVVGEILARVKSIYVDNHISEEIKEDEFKITNFKGEVLNMVPIMARVDNGYAPAVRIILNDPGRFTDLALIDLKSMHNVLNKIDIMTLGSMFAIMGDRV